MFISPHDRVEASGKAALAPTTLGGTWTTGIARTAQNGFTKYGLTTHGSAPADGNTPDRSVQQHSKTCRLSPFSRDKDPGHSVCATDSPLRIPLSESRPDLVFQRRCREISLAFDQPHSLRSFVILPGIAVGRLDRILGLIFLQLGAHRGIHIQAQVMAQV